MTGPGVVHHALLLSIWLVAVGGCARSQGEDRADVAAGAGPTTSIVTGNLGVLAPNEHGAYRFDLQNTDDVAWTVKAVHTSCSCTVAVPDWNRIPPATSKPLLVEYKAGATNYDEKRDVVVVFEEPSAPLLVLRLYVRVREVFSIDPCDLMVDLGADARSTDAYFQADNYSHLDWRGIQALSMPEWVRLSSISEIDTPPGAQQPRQSWRVALELTRMPEMHERKRGIIHLKANSTVVYKTAVPVSLRVSSPVDVSPRNLFFGKVQTETPVSTRFQLRFNGQRPPFNEDSIVFDHDLGTQLSFAVTRKRDDYWEFEATLLARESFPLKQSHTVVLKFAEAGILPLSMPVIAMVGTKE